MLFGQTLDLIPAVVIESIVVGLMVLEQPLY